MRGGFPVVCSSDACSFDVKEVAAFMAWWIVFVWLELKVGGAGHVWSWIVVYFIDDDDDDDQFCCSIQTFLF